MPEATFEQIKLANEAIVTTDIKGKAYADVAQRIKAFRMVYPTGTIETEMVSNIDGICIFRAEVGYRDDLFGHVVLGTGTAFERQGASYINKTSYIENCETSAVGRALGMAGFGIDVSVASADEVANAIAQQEAAKKSDGDVLSAQMKTDLQAFTILKKRLMAATGWEEQEAGKVVMQVGGNPLELTDAERKDAIAYVESYVSGWEEQDGESE